MVAAAMLFLTALAVQSGAALPPFFAGWLGSLPPSRQVAVAALAFAGSAVAANLVRILFLRLSEKFTAYVAHELTMAVHSRVFAQPYDYHVRHHSSELLGSLEAVQLLAFNLIHQWLQSVAALATGVAFAWLLVAIDPLPAMAAFAVLGLFYLLVARLASRQLRWNSGVVGRAYGERIRKVQESLGAIRDLKIDHSESAQLEDLRQANARYAEASASTAFIAGSPRFVIEGGAVLLIAALAALLSSKGDGGALLLVGGIALGGLRLLPLLQQAYRSWAMTAANRGIMAQVVELLSLPMPDDRSHSVTPLALRASVSLEHISYRYPERAEPALEYVTLEIERGSRVALVGETGSGKSTLADVTMGLLRPHSGVVRVDGTVLGEDRIRDWQANIAHVSQSVFIADASIARNIGFSVPESCLDMARVRAAATRAEIAEFIGSLPDGYETVVGERGVRLSGGQRQRIALARAIYKDAPFMVLDEATNALDEETESKVLANLFADRTRTILVIAHRPSAVAHCDKVVKLAGGSVADITQAVDVAHNNPLVS
jgi:ATP-binding cassette, subfamily B, bacterial PglK